MKKRIIHNVIIAGDFPFPTGSASAVRVRNMAMALKECGINVMIQSIFPILIQETTLSLRGEFCGLPFENLGLFLEAAENQKATIPSGWRKIQRIVNRYKVVVKTRKKIEQLISEKKCDALIVYGRGITRIPPLISAYIRRNVVTVLDVVEHYDNAELFANQYQYWDYRLGEMIIPRLFDGFSLITSELQRLYQSRGKINTIVFPHVGTWDDSAALQHKVTHSAVFRLVYVGSLITRDAPQMLLEIIQNLVSDGIPVILDIIGDYGSSLVGKQYQMNFLSSPALKDHVNWIGKVTDEELQRRIAAADGLILTRRDDQCERYSFPTRLFEFLQTGKPVFVSGVGVVLESLQPGRDAVVLDAVSSKKAAAEIAGVVTSPDRGRSIGLNGYKRGAELFDGRTHARDLLDFMEKLAAEKKYRKSSK